MKIFETIWTDFKSRLFGTKPFFKTRNDRELAWYGSLWVWVCKSFFHIEIEGIPVIRDFPSYNSDVFK